MARKVVDTGVVGNDGTGDSIRDSFSKVNDNFRELYSSLGLGERLTFIGLDDTPSTFLGNEGAVVSVNETTDGVKFKQITAGVGVSVDTASNANQIIISNEPADILLQKSEFIISSGPTSIVFEPLFYGCKLLYLNLEPSDIFIIKKNLIRQGRN